MGKYRTEPQLQGASGCFYRATAQGRARGAVGRVDGWSPYHYDLLGFCEAGVWEHELRQFMPPASLRSSLAALLAAGLIECLEHPQELMAA
ncbi:MAG: hypothetical protein ACXWJM_14350 [Ramlibacter sp.]